MRIGFLFNNRSYKLWHAAPIAFELSQLNPGAEITIFCADQTILEMAEHIATGYPGHRCHMEVLYLPAFVRGVKYLSSGLMTLDKEVLLYLNTWRFVPLDALVVADDTCLLLKRQLPALNMILADHGAGDRAVGFKPRIAKFDFIIVPGVKHLKRYKAAQLLRDDGHAVVGYVKFSAVEKTLPAPPKIFENDRPTVLYNPHFQASLSSWLPWGKQVLDFFVRNAEHYNLIFAPHTKLFERWLRHGGYLPRRFQRCSNIHIDLGSLASENMSYTRAADIYLGDVSSQVYEFLYQPRPCLFLNPRGIDWKGDPNYAHWQLGPVLGEIEGLGAALSQAADTHNHFKQVQERAFANTFELDETPSDLRAAIAIQQYLAPRVEMSMIPSTTEQQSALWLQ